ncbi:hypothetical protein BD560DRAFT_62710 [Blakeslea trispora]|nr:hypothetical protein BD560DRAFT_62710 [Blakeslea trispora]
MMPLSRSPRPDRSYSPHSTKSSSSYSRSRSRSPSSSSYRRPRSRSISPYYRRRPRYYSRSPPPSSVRRPPPRRYRSRSPRRARANKDCRVYVSNLSFDVTWHQLKDFMREAGQVVHVDVLKMSNGRSKGCGVVEYRYPEDARRAIHSMNKAEFMGRPVFVREDREYEHASKDPRDAPEECRLHVSNLPLNASWQDMKDLFRKAGRVLHTDVHTDPGSRRPNGHGTVIFDDPHYTRIALDMFHGYEWQGCRLQVEEEGGGGRHTSNVKPLNESPVSVDYPDPKPVYSHPHHFRHETPILSSSLLPPPPPPPPAVLPPLQSNVPPLYSFVGGPAANLPTHGHNQIFVNNLPFSTTWQDLIDLFRHVGPVLRSEILTVNGYPKGSGFVRFEDAVTCEKAIEKFHGYMYGGRYLDIRLDKYSTTI